MGLKRIVSMILFIAWTLLPLGSLPAAAQSRPYKEGELLVRFRTGTSTASRTALARSAGALESRAIGNSHIQRVMIEPGATVNQALAVYAADPNVEFAEPNYIVHPQSLPDDTYFNLQWGLYNTGQSVSGLSGITGADMDAPSAWDITTGSSNVVVAVVDTGCNLGHPDLAASIWLNPGEIPGNGVDDDGNGYIDDIQGWDFADMDNVPQDATGHGSHVAGIIAAAGDNGRGIAGVARGVRILPLRFMNAFNEGSIADAIDAIEYALAKGVKIINCSWGTSSNSIALRNVIANADALFICASGNNGGDADLYPFYPASLSEDQIVSVAASNQLDQLAWFSNYGTMNVDVAAPGDRIFSLSLGRQTLCLENFADGFPAGWSTGGAGDTWSVADPPYTVNAPALALSPSSDYSNDADTWVRTPALDLGLASASQLTFRLIGSSQTYQDYLQLEVSTNGSTWHACPLQMGGTIKYNGISGSVPSWMTVKADLGPWDGSSQLFFRLHFKSDSADTDSGFYIDNLQLTAASQTESYQFMQGTSMAAAYVSGLAALILSEDDGLTPREIKTIIENSVDLNQNLLERVASGGRVNAYNALTLLRELSLTAAPAAADRIQLSWTAQAALNSQVVIERRMDGQSEFQTLALVDSETSTYADGNVIANSTYFYRVQAQTEDGRSGYSNQTLATAQGTLAAGSSGGGGGGGCFITSLWLK